MLRKPYGPTENKTLGAKNNFSPHLNTLDTLKVLLITQVKFHDNCLIWRTKIAKIKQKTMIHN